VISVTNRNDNKKITIIIKKAGSYWKNNRIYTINAVSTSNTSCASAIPKFLRGFLEGNLDSYSTKN